MPHRPEIRLSVEQKRIVWRLQSGGPAPRTVLAQELGLHNAAMTRLTRELITLGVIEEAEADSRSARGRPTVPLSISSRAGYAAGATVHPGWLEISLVDFTGRIIARDQEPFDSPDPALFVEAVNRRLHGLAMTNGVLRSRCLGLGVAATGPMIARDSQIRWAVPWLAGWRDVALQSYFAERFDLAVRVENDATLAALAEYYHGGIIRQSGSALVFFIGHGVGGGMIVDRTPLRGEYGNAGEIGRLFPAALPRPSGIDLLACLQAADADVQSLLDITSVLTSHRETIEAWVERAANQLEIAIDAGVAWLDPGAIVLSGALPEPIMQALGERLQRAGWTTHHDHLPRARFHLSTLGSWAVAVGAALLPIHEIIRPD